MLLQTQPMLPMVAMVLPNAATSSTIAIPCCFGATSQEKNTNYQMSTSVRQCVEGCVDEAPQEFSGANNQSILPVISATSAE